MLATLLLVAATVAATPSPATQTFVQAPGMRSRHSGIAVGMRLLVALTTPPMDCEP